MPTLFSHTGVLCPSTLPRFVASIVNPCLNVSVASIPANMEDLISRMTCIIRGGVASEDDGVRLKLACSALKMDLDEHPLISGLSLACARMLDKHARGIFNLAGRKDENCSERERGLLADCGQQLAMASCNSRLAKEFGLAKSALKICIDDLHQMSLPMPPLAIRWPQHLRENFNLIDQRYFRQPEVPIRPLILLRYIFLGAVGLKDLKVKLVSEYLRL